jgi:hypothetical protein
MAEIANDGSMEFAGIMNSIAYMEAHWKKLIAAVDPCTMGISGSESADEILYTRFRAQFPMLDVNMVNNETLKNSYAKEQWRKFMEASEGLVLDFNMITLVRVNAEFGYEQWNTIMVPRMQFYCIEVARNKEGVNEKVRMDNLTDTIITRCEKLSAAMSGNNLHAALAILDSLSQHAVLPANVLRESGVGKTMTRLGKTEKFPTLAAKARRLTSQWKHGLTLLKIRDRAASQDANAAGGKASQENADIVAAVDFVLKKLASNLGAGDNPTLTADVVETPIVAGDLLIDCAKADESNALPEEVVQEAAACMSEHGVCYFKDVLPDGYAEECLKDAGKHKCCPLQISHCRQRNASL